MTEGFATLRLLAWLSPAFPTGGYAYSHGIEWAVETSDITDGATLQGWLEDVLRIGAGRRDAILLRHAHRARTPTSTALAEIVELALATSPSRERRAETVGQGNAFVAAAASWRPAVLTALARPRRRHRRIPSRSARWRGPAASPPPMPPAAPCRHSPPTSFRPRSGWCRWGSPPDWRARRAGTRHPRGDRGGRRPPASTTSAAPASAPTSHAMRHETQYTRLFRS